MIQRIQSVYLLLASACLAAVLFFSSVWAQAAEAFGWFRFAFLAAGVAASGVALIAIFLYQNRQAQRRIVSIAQVLALVEAALLYGGLYLAGGLYFTAPTGGFDTARIVALLLPLIGYLLLFLARRAIAGDIELVRSMDRLR